MHTATAEPSRTQYLRTGKGEGLGTEQVSVWGCCMQTRVSPPHTERKHVSCPCAFFGTVPQSSAQVSIPTAGETAPKVGRRKFFLFKWRLLK